MTKTLIVALMLVAGTVQAQTCESQFAAKLKVISASCSTNEDCQKEINAIKACLPEDYSDQGVTAKGAIAKLEAEITNNNKLIALEKKQETLPGARIGMSTKTVINDTQWGAPKKINRTTTASGVREQWVYDHCGYNRCYKGYLYFTNGVLTSIQN